MTKINVPSNTTQWHHVPRYDVLRKTEHPFQGILAKNEKSQSNHEKNPKTQSERQTTRQQKNSVQKCQGHEKQRKIENYHRLEETKETQQWNAMWRQWEDKPDWEKVFAKDLSDHQPMFQVNSEKK